MPDQTTDPCPTPETHNWGCGCPSDVAAAIASCPGRELSPSPCRCPCYGCKHHCGAHNPETVPPVVQSPIREQLLNAIDATFCQSLGFGTPEGLLAAYEASRTQTVDQTALERAARRLASRDWLVDETDDDDWQRRGPEFRADYMAWAREVLAAVLPATTNHDTDTSAGWLDAAAECNRAGGAYAERGANDAAGAAFALMETFLRKAGEAEYVATPCSGVPCEDGGEPCDVHERLMGHAEGDHELCAPDCGEPWLRRVADETAATATPWPTQQRWRIELFDYLAEEWSPGGTRWPTREQAMERLQLMREKAPVWKDGPPVERRVVRETTTYTVEPEPAAGARQDGAQA